MFCVISIQLLEADDNGYLYIGTNFGLNRYDLDTGRIIAFTEINGFSVEEMSDLRIAMVDAQVGETVTITVLRNSGNAEAELMFTVELSLSPPPMTHP